MAALPDVECVAVLAGARLRSGNATLTGGTCMIVAFEELVAPPGDGPFH